MLDIRGIESRGSQSLSTGTNFINNKGFPTSYMQDVHKKNTVKELLMMKRQKWNSSQDNNDFCKYDTSPPIFQYPYCNIPPHCTPENGHMTPQQIHDPALQGQASPATEVKLTLFHWQLQQEEQKISGLSPELLNMQDADGDTFLHIAVAQNRRAMAYVLAAKMARCGSLDTKEHNGQTALHIAAATNQHLIVQDLLTHGAQINTRDLWGRSPLHICAEKGHFLSLQSIGRTLMGSGQLIDIEMFNYDGLTALHAAVVSHNAVVRELRKRGNPCSRVTMELMQRCQMYVECIKTLLLMGASFGAKDLKSGRTCLHMASEEANLDLFNIFLEQPFSLSIVNAKTFSGNTALHMVSSLHNHKTQVEAVKLLMRKGADPGSRNLENELPSQLVPEGPVGEKVRQILKGKYCNA